MRTPRRQLGQYKSTLETDTAISFDKRPPCGLRRLGFRCLYTRFMPSTTTLFLSPNTRRTRPVVGDWVLPASSPVVTSTMSPLRICIYVSLRSAAPRGQTSDDFRSQVGNLHEALFTQFASNGAENARATRLFLVVDQDHGIAVEANVAAILPSGGPANTHDHAFDHITRLHFTAGNGLLHTGHDDIAQSGVALAAAAQNFDAHTFFGPGV